MNFETAESEDIQRARDPLHQTFPVDQLWTQTRGQTEQDRLADRRRTAEAAVDVLVRLHGDTNEVRDRIFSDLKNLRAEIDRAEQPSFTLLDRVEYLKAQLAVIDERRNANESVRVAPSRFVETKGASDTVSIPAPVVTKSVGLFGRVAGFFTSVKERFFSTKPVAEEGPRATGKPMEVYETPHGTTWTPARREQANVKREQEMAALQERALRADEMGLPAIENRLKFARGRSDTLVALLRADGSRRTMPSAVRARYEKELVDLGAEIKNLMVKQNAARNIADGVREFQKSQKKEAA